MYTFSNELSAALILKVIFILLNYILFYTYFYYGGYDVNIA